MVTLTAYKAMDMDNPVVWYGTATIATASHIQLSSGSHVQDYYGSFTYSSVTLNLTGGTVTSTVYWENGVKMYLVTGGNWDVLTVNSYLNTGNIAALYDYVFAGNDTLFGSSEADSLKGLNGNDTLKGNAGNDLLKGGDGRDSLDGGAGGDTMLGGAGGDSYYVNSSLDAVYETTSIGSGIDAGGTDIIYSRVNHAGGGMFTLPDFVENGRILANGTSNMSGNGLANVIHAGAGDNILTGANGSDTLCYAYATAGVTISLASTAAQATGGSGTDTISGFERLTGSAYGDSLTGNGSANILKGGAGDDSISGAGGSDTLQGEAGTDLLRGGGGNDILLGGVGNDSFRFDTTLSASANVDKIKDFSAAYDTIELENAIFAKFGTSATGTIAAGTFHAINTGEATDANDYIVYLKDTGAVYYDANGNVNGMADAVNFAMLSPNLALTNADFVLV